MGKYEEKTREYFDKTASTYDSRFDGRIAACFHDTVLEKLVGMGRRSVLDIGCGTGVMLSRISAMSPDVKLHGVDISPEMTGIARNRLGAKAEVSTCDICSNQLSYADDSFDCVTCMTAFHHFSNPRGALAEIYRVISTDGKLIIADVTTFYPVRQLDNLLFYVSRFLPLHNDGDYRIYSKRELCGLLESCRFQSIRWEAVAGPNQLFQLFVVIATPLK
ncbi:MAG: class I SAM-dependent methyltransferase [Dehalococcoidia bacterium]|nr:class I SAM-dependent methyltransferase [Dehalococcoidia bacterium]